MVFAGIPANHVVKVMKTGRDRRLCNRRFAGYSEKRQHEPDAGFDGESVKCIASRRLQGNPVSEVCHKNDLCLRFRIEFPEEPDRNERRHLMDTGGSFLPGEEGLLVEGENVAGLPDVSPGIEDCIHENDSGVFRKLLDVTDEVGACADQVRVRPGSLYFANKTVQHEDSECIIAAQ